MGWDDEWMDGWMDGTWYMAAASTHSRTKALLQTACPRLSRAATGRHGSCRVVSVVDMVSDDPIIIPQRQNTRTRPERLDKTRQT